MATLSKEMGGQTNDFLSKITNSLAEVPFKCVLIKAYKGNKYYMKFKQIGHSIILYGQFPQKNY